jgi:hypothetical protein
LLRQRRKKLAEPGWISRASGHCARNDQERQCGRPAEGCEAGVEEDEEDDDDDDRPELLAVEDDEPPLQPLPRLPALELPPE